MGPEKPPLWLAGRFAGPFPAEDSKAEEVIEAAAVNPDHDDLAAVEQRGKRQGAIGAALPIFRASPAVRAESQPDLDVEMLRRPDPFRVLALFFFALPIRH